MPRTLEEVRQIALELPEEDRRLLANSLWESIESDAQVDEAWKVEVERRIDAFEAGTSPTYTWEEVKSRLHARHAR